MHDLQSDDEIACMAHEAGHIFSPNQSPQPSLADEQDADRFAIPLVMIARSSKQWIPVSQDLRKAMRF